MKLLEKHLMLFCDCGIEFTADIKDIYRNIFKLMYNDIMTKGSFESYFELADILNNYSDRKNWKFFSFCKECCNDVDVCSYGFYCPCTCDGKHGSLIFTIAHAKTMIHFVNLEFKPIVF